MRRRVAQRGVERLEPGGCVQQLIVVDVQQVRDAALDGALDGARHEAHLTLRLARPRAHGAARKVRLHERAATARAMGGWIPRDERCAALGQVQACSGPHTPPRRSAEQRLELRRVFDAEEEGCRTEHSSVVLQPRLEVRRSFGHADDTDPHRSVTRWRWHPCRARRLDRRGVHIRRVVRRRYEPLHRRRGRTLLREGCVRLLLRPRRLLMLLGEQHKPEVDPLGDTAEAKRGQVPVEGACVGVVGQCAQLLEF
eukprot:5388858-Prymnesium_polylepis.1